MRPGVLLLLVPTVAVFLLSISRTASADEFGIYFDQEAGSQCLVSPSFVPVKLYVLYSNPTVPEISGFELGIRHTGSALVGAVLVPCGSTITDTEQISVLCGTPIPCNPITVLLEISAMFPGGWDYFELQQASNPSSGYSSPVVFLPGGGVLEVDGSGSLAVIDGGYEICAGLPVERNSWGTIKATFRSTRGVNP